LTAPKQDHGASKSKIVEQANDTTTTPMRLLGSAKESLGECGSSVQLARKGLPKYKGTMKTASLRKMIEQVRNSILRVMTPLTPDLSMDSEQAADALAMLVTWLRGSEMRFFIPKKVQPYYHLSPML